MRRSQNSRNPLSRRGHGRAFPEHPGGSREGTETGIARREAGDDGKHDASSSGLHPSAVIISGGTGSGRTKLWNAFSALIPHEERIVTIERATDSRAAVAATTCGWPGGPHGQYGRPVSPLTGPSSGWRVARYNRGSGGNGNAKANPVQPVGLARGGGSGKRITELLRVCDQLCCYPCLCVLVCTELC